LSGFFGCTFFITVECIILSKFVNEKYLVSFACPFNFVNIKHLEPLLGKDNVLEIVVSDDFPSDIGHIVIYFNDIEEKKNWIMDFSSSKSLYVPSPHLKFEKKKKGETKKGTMNSLKKIGLGLGKKKKVSRKEVKKNAFVSSAREGSRKNSLENDNETSSETSKSSARKSITGVAPVPDRRPPAPPPRGSVGSKEDPTNKSRGMQLNTQDIVNARTGLNSTGRNNY